MSEGDPNTSMSNIIIENQNEAGSFIMDGPLCENGLNIIQESAVCTSRVPALAKRLSEPHTVRLDSIILRKTDGTTVSICLKPISRAVETSDDNIKGNYVSGDLKAYVFCEDNSNFESEISELDAETDFEDMYDDIEDSNDINKADQTPDGVLNGDKYAKMNRKVKLRKKKQHLSKDPIPCQYCGVLIPGSKIKQHENMKHNKSWFLQCDECDYQTKYSATLRRHKDMHKFHRGEIKKIHDCPVCGKKIRYSYNLKTHMKLHEDSKPFTCSLCGKQFTQKNNYLVHCRRHEKTRDKAEKSNRKHQFPCLECGKLFKWNHDAKKHYRNVHLRLLKFSCSQCNKAFADKSALNIHIASAHVKQKEFACSHCNKLYNNKYQLAGHIRDKHKLEFKYEKQYKRSKNGNDGKGKKVSVNIDTSNNTADNITLGHSTVEQNQVSVDENEQDLNLVSECVVAGDNDMVII